MMISRPYAAAVARKIRKIRSEFASEKNTEKTFLTGLPGRLQFLLISFLLLRGSG
jgi:hypothetical protein